MSRTVMITGAGGGVGGELVRRAAARGDRVFAAARAPIDWSSTPGAVIPLIMDIVDDGSVASAFQTIRAVVGDGKLDAVIHAAAIAPHGAVELTDAADFAVVLDVNAVGTYRVLRAAMPMLRAADGRFIVISSLWSRMGGPLLAGYAASKHAIAALTDSVRREQPGFSVSVIELGVVKTKMLEGQSTAWSGHVIPGGYQKLYDSYRQLTLKAAPSALTVEEAGKAIERALLDRRPMLIYRVGNDAKAVAALAWFLPRRAIDWIFSRLIKR